jgi:hypothetical protein
MTIFQTAGGLPVWMVLGIVAAGSLTVILVLILVIKYCKREMKDEKTSKPTL